MGFGGGKHVDRQRHVSHRDGEMSARDAGDVLWQMRGYLRRISETSSAEVTDVSAAAGDVLMPCIARLSTVKAVDSGQFGPRLLLWSELTVLLARCRLRRNTEPGN